METYIALLRGINVSGQRIIKMEWLRRQFEAMGFEQVRTYIQSGNIIFLTKKTTEKKQSCETYVRTLYFF